MLKVLKDKYSVQDDQDLLAMCALQLCVKIEKSSLEKTDSKQKIIEDILEIKSKVNGILEKVGLESVKKMFPSQLSGGEQQRVSIARALVKNPLVILADEPTGNLDPNVSDEILDLLELATSNGTSVLMSTHNFPLIRPRRKRYIELNDGRLVPK